MSSRAIKITVIGQIVLLITVVFLARSHEFEGVPKESFVQKILYTWHEFSLNARYEVVFTKLAIYKGYEIRRNQAKVLAVDFVAKADTVWAVAMQNMEILNQTYYVQNDSDSELFSDIAIAMASELRWGEYYAYASEFFISMASASDIKSRVYPTDLSVSTESVGLVSFSYALSDRRLPVFGDIDSTFSMTFSEYKENSKNVLNLVFEKDFGVNKKGDVRVSVSRNRFVTFSSHIFDTTDWNLPVRKSSKERVGIRANFNLPQLKILEDVMRADSLLSLPENNIPDDKKHMALVAVMPDSSDRIQIIKVARSGRGNQSYAKGYFVSSGRYINHGAHIWVGAGYRVLRYKVRIYDKRENVWIQPRFTPYSTFFLENDIAQIGEWYVEALKNKAYHIIRNELKIASVAIPGEFIDEWLPAEMIRYILMLENGGWGSRSIEKVMAKIALNRGDMAQYAHSPADAKGFFQIIEPTFSSVVEQYGIDAYLKREGLNNYDKITRHHIYSAVVATLLFDSDMSTPQVPFAIKKDKWLREKSSVSMIQYLAACYNGGVYSGLAALERRKNKRGYGMVFAKRIEHPETRAYISNLNKIVAYERYGFDGGTN